MKPGPLSEYADFLDDSVHCNSRFLCCSMFSFGVVLHELFSAPFQVPWLNLSDEAIFQEHKLGHSPPVHASIESRYPAIARLIRQCAQHSPQNRPSAQDAVKLLQKYVQRRSLIYAASVTSTLHSTFSDATRNRSSTMLSSTYVTPPSSKPPTPTSTINESNNCKDTNEKQESRSRSDTETRLVLGTNQFTGMQFSSSSNSSSITHESTAYSRVPPPLPPFPVYNDDDDDEL